MIITWLKKSSKSLYKTKLPKYLKNYVELARIPDDKYVVSKLLRIKQKFDDVTDSNFGDIYFLTQERHWVYVVDKKVVSKYDESLFKELL